jgi:hypothetical protein
MLVSSTIFCQHFGKCCNIFKNIGQYFSPFFKVRPTFFRMLQHFFRNICSVNYILSTFGKMLQQFSLKCGKQQFRPSSTSRRRRHGVRGVVHTRGRRATKPGGARSWHGREGVAAAPGGDSRRPVARHRGPWQHGGGRASDRDDAKGPADGAWVERGGRGGADQRRRGGAARSRVAAVGNGEEEEGCET